MNDKQVISNIIIMFTGSVMVINSIMIVTTNDLDMLINHVLMFTVMTIIMGVSMAYLEGVERNK
jgi:hypothetical protein